MTSVPKQIWLQSAGTRMYLWGVTLVHRAPPVSEAICQVLALQGTGFLFWCGLMANMCLKGRGPGHRSNDTCDVY